MKKNFKLVLALVLAAMMIASMIPAMAAQQSLSITDPMTGHTYTAYQLFVGDLAADGITLSNVKWGSNAATATISYTLSGTAKTVTPSVGALVDKDFLEYCKNLPSNDKSTADFFGGLVTGTGTTISATAVNVDTGYYVIKDAYNDATADQTTTLSTIICKVVGPTAIQNKAGTTTHKKEVADVNDTTEVQLDLTDLTNIDTSAWSTSADYDIGDYIPFKLTTTIASDFAKYTSYYLAVTDTMSGGLVLDPDSIAVYVGGTKVDQGTADNEYDLDVVTGNKKFTVKFDKLNAVTTAAAGADVIVYYKAQLTSTGVVYGNNGNENESYATFSNNPNGNQTGTGDTPPSINVVFTYKTVVNKVDENNDPLGGAAFKLEKKIKGVSGAADTWSQIATFGPDASTTTFSFEGLDDGTYKLTETTTPDGYNTIDPITFIVTATHTASGTTLSLTDENGAEFTGEIQFTKISDNQGYSTDIVNQSGATLPSTGGIGTTIFYVAGSILVLAAAILLITKRRMGADE